MKTAIYVIFILLFSLASLVQAQESPDLTKARQDYLFQFSSYSSAHEKYLNAKDIFEKFGTIQAQQDAISTAKQALTTRAQSLISYLELLKIVLTNLQSMDVSLRNSQFGKLEASQSFLRNHAENIKKTQSIAEINEESARFEREYEPLEDLAYESLSVILIGRLQSYEARANSLVNNFENSDKLPKTQAVTQGISQIKNKLSQTRLSIDKAVNTIVEYQKDRLGKGNAAYKNVQKDINEGKQTLREAAQLLKELEDLAENE